MFNKHRTLGNFASFLLSKAGAILFFLFGVHFFMLGAGPTEYGAINLILVLYTYLWIADVGLGYSVNLRIGRMLARRGTAPDSCSKEHRHTDEIVTLLRRAVPFYAAVAIGLALAANCAQKSLSEALFNTAQYAGLVAWTGLAAPAVMASALSGAVLRAFDKVYLVNGTQFLMDAWRGTCLIFLAGEPEPALAAGQAFVAGAVVRALIDVALVSRLLGWGWLVPGWSWSEVVQNVRIGAPTMGSLVISSVFYSADRIFASRTFSLESAANYSIAADLHTKAYFLLWAINAALYQPLLARHTLQRPVGALGHLNAGGAAAVALIYYVPLATFAPEIISLWVDDAAAEAASATVWAMLPGSIAYVLASSLENAQLRTRGIVLAPMLVHAAMLMTMLATLSLISESHGIAGIGWAHSLANMVFLVGTVAVVLRNRRPVG